MKFRIDSDLSFLGNEYTDLISAETQYGSVRSELLGPIKRQIETWKNQGTMPDEVTGKTFDDLGFAVTERYGRENIPECFNGNPFVLGDFFGDIVCDDEFTLQGTELRMHFRKSITDVIEKAKYQGLRESESRFFQKLCQHLGADFKGIFLFSATGSPIFRIVLNRDEFKNPPVLGHWDYVDDDYRKTGNVNDPRYEEGILEKLRSYGIKNPENIDPVHNVFWTKATNKTDSWKGACRANKSTRLVPWTVGAPAPKEIEYGSYDLALAESDQTPQLAPKELLDLAKKDGYIVVKSYLVPEFEKFGDRITCLLENPEGDFSLLKKS